MQTLIAKLPPHVASWVTSLACASLDDLVRAVERFRNRPITVEEILPFEGRPWLAAQWFDLGDRDLIVHLPVGSELYRHWLVCHELAHMILGHSPSPAGCTDGDEERDAGLLANHLLGQMWGAGRAVSSWEKVFVA